MPFKDDGSRPVVLQAFGSGDSFIAEQRLSFTRRHTGLLPNRPPVTDRPKRLVKGRVITKDGGTARGLGGVVITDWGENHRTLTDRDGNFEFEARFADDSVENMRGTDRDHSDLNDWVNLTAYADGYVMTGRGVMQNGNPGQRYYNGINFGPDEVNSPEGLLIEMKWQGLEEIRVKIANPPSDLAGVTITVESHTAESSQQDDGFFLSSQPDKDGLAVFRIPNRRHLEIHATGEKWRSAGPAIYDSTQRAWMLTLTATDSYRITGTVTDQRSGMAIAGIRVRANSDRQVSYTAADGSFSIWVRGESQAPHLLFEHPSYLRANANLNAELQGSISLAVGGTSPSGPWKIIMRPAVLFKATVLPSEGGGFSGVKSVEVKIDERSQFVVHARLNGGAAELSIPNFPWGAERLTVVAESQDRQGTEFHIVELPQSTWNAANEYDLRLFSTSGKRN